MLNKVYMVGSTHYDPVWLWTWDEGMSSIRSTFRAALERMKEDSAFIYSFSCPPVFEQIKSVEPAMFEEIKRRVAEGRWHLTEGLWVQPDCYSASGEGYARQCLHAQRYLAENFGCISRSAFNTDSFGHSPLLPQILSKSGIVNYVFGRPDNSEFPLEDPLFFWESRDGSKITAYHIGDNGADFTADSTAAQIEIALGKLNSFNHDLMLIYGVTNHGGAPTKKAISEIHRMNAATEGRVVFSDTGKFFNDQKEIPLKTYYGEISVRYFGVFANFPQIKKGNRKSEYMLYNAERAALFDSMATGASYPSENLSSSCRDILFNHFHDILGGASITDACRDAFLLYGRSLQTTGEIMHSALQRITSLIALDPNEHGSVWNLVVWNLNSFEYEGAVEGEVQWAWEFDWYNGDICVFDDLGTVYTTQNILPRSVIPGFRSRFVFRASIPALGYKVFRVCQRKAENNTVKLTADRFIMENNLYRVEVCDQTGGIKQIIKKDTGKIITGNCAFPLVLEDKSDVWAFNFTGYKKCEDFRLRSAEILECGEVRCRIRTISDFNRSELIQDFFLYAGSDVIEGDYKVIWHEKHKTLKLRFCPIAEKMLIKASVPYGSIQRNFDAKEMPVSEWMTAGDGQNGMTLSFDSLFAYDTDAGEIRATVLRSPIVGDLHISDLDPNQPYEYLSQGITEGRWRLIPRVCGDTEAFRHGTMLNNPPVIVTEANHSGMYPMCKGFAFCEDDGVFITALKRSEDTKAVIVRLQNMTCDTRVCRLQLGNTAEKIAMSPYEIKTLRIDNGVFREVCILEDDIDHIVYKE